MMRKLMSCLSILLFLPGWVMAECATVTPIHTGYRLDIPCLELGGQHYRLALDLDTVTLNFVYAGHEVARVDSICAVMDGNLNIDIPCVSFLGSTFSLPLIYHPALGVWRLPESGGNNPPEADGVTLNVDSSIPYIVQQLSARDPDGDMIQYELISPVSGTGYADAFINPSNGRLYVTHEPAGNSAFSLSYRVSDGQLFSDPAMVSVNVTYLSEENKNTGRNEVDAERYASFALSTLNSRLLGAVGEAPATPRSIDLSPNFPTPGDQGNQNSCVGWATAYALKSYQERVEIGWPLNTPDHLFSPSFLYNQINYQQDRGSYINEALDLAVNTGLATLSKMPYSDQDYLTQPSQAAFTEAADFKAAGWRRVNDTSQIKAALANGRPVVGGISVYEQLMQLRGTDSVYNTASGNNQGGHAITIVGYDDDRYGGALKVINSWGQAWGDGGYFWMPYQFAASGIMSEAYVLEDAENSQAVTPVEEPTQPIPDQNSLPNLTVEMWNADYNPQPRGSGSLTYSVKNTGAGSAAAGAYVALIISRNPEFSPNDDMVVYEMLPDLAPGASVYRDETNAIPFNFPDQLEGGTYYMTVVVDPMDMIDESLESDNASPGNQPVEIRNTLPDLVVDTWYAQWDGYGNGTLTYQVSNSGASSTTSMAWDINLILDQDQVVGNGNEIYLFYEKAQFILDPGGYIYRDAWNAEYFNLYETYDGYPVPAGTYYMALWVDDRNVEAESNELNNGSYSWGTVQVGSSWWRSNGNRSLSANGDSVGLDGDTGSGREGVAYNGRQLPAPSDLSWKKVVLQRSLDGRRGVNSGEGHNPGTQQLSVVPMESVKGEKRIFARTGVVFPTSVRTKMP